MFGICHRAGLATRAMVALALLAGVSFGAAGSSAAEITKLKIGNWGGGAFTNDNTGAFSHCAASARYKSGITLLFSVTGDGVWSMGFSSPTWELAPNTTYPVRYRVDEGEVLQGTALAKNKQLAQVFLPRNDSLFTAFRYGGMLRVEAERQTLSFRLTDTSELLTTLLRCARDHSNARSNNPFGSGTRPPPAPAPAPTNPFGPGTAPKAPAPKGETI